MRTWTITKDGAQSRVIAGDDVELLDVVALTDFELMARALGESVDKLTKIEEILVEGNETIPEMLAALERLVQ